MSAPFGWDHKSWADVCLAREQLQALLLLLRAAEGKEEPSADRLEALFVDIAEVGQRGAMAASWCKS